MYRCTECYTEYEVCPEFCDCGNDTFDEVDVYSESEEEYYEPEPRPRQKKKKRPLTEEEIEELKELEEEKKKSMIVIGISIVISLIILAIPPYMPKKVPQNAPKVQKNIKMPEIKDYWDNKIASPLRKVDETSKLPILNRYMNSISPVLKDYLRGVGSIFSKNWNSTIVDGSGECRVYFTINKDGTINSNGITQKSGNETLDDSVLMLLDKVKSYDIPPDDYNGERIVISFKKDKNGTTKVYIPTMK